ncbi:MAG: hypothetical protein OXC57_10435 [Rhodobacteraceae bacterium]|nr:hypothetical protein [Paracoccaceae bacterium]
MSQRAGNRQAHGIFYLVIDKGSGGPYPAMDKQLGFDLPDHPAQHPFTGEVAQDLPEGQDTGKGCRVLDGGKFDLDREGFFNYHNANPMGWFFVLVMRA